LHAILTLVLAAAMGPLQYYVGTWSCRAGAPGTTPGPSTATYALEAGVLREIVHVPPTGSMKRAYAISVATAWDAKNNRYVTTRLDNQGNWSVLFAKPWSGNTEYWFDHASSSSLKHSQNVRISRDRFEFRSYPTLTSTKAGYVGVCTRLI
jgi:hypothetical protein